MVSQNDNNKLPLKPDNSSSGWRFVPFFKYLKYKSIFDIEFWLECCAAKMKFLPLVEYFGFLLAKFMLTVMKSCFKVMNAFVFAKRKRRRQRFVNTLRH